MIGVKLLIINSLQGGGGHRLGRLFSCYKNVYWYKHPNNGLKPWEFAQNDKIKEAIFSKYHYDRILEDGTPIPLIGSRIEKYWDNSDWYYNWRQLMANIKLPKKYITYVVHDSPSYLRLYFPKAYIVNLLSDPDYATKRHMQTSANFRINFKLIGQRPNYKSVWVKKVDELLMINPDATESDLWEYMYGTNYYDEMIKRNRNKNKINDAEKESADITIDLDSFDPQSLEDYFGKINANYKRLML
jgi:hypothetical protein